MRVMVLGATGFLGSWATRSLLASGAEVCAVVRPESSLWRIAQLSDVEVVVASSPDWGRAIIDQRPEVILSLDWAGVAGSARDDASQFLNLDRLRSTVRAAAEAGVSKFVGVGSQAEYGPRHGVIRETDDCAPVTAYGAAKLEACHWLLGEAATSDFKTVWVRVFSTFGPLDHPHWVLPQLAEKVLAGEPAPLTDGKQRWSFLPGPDAGDALATVALTDGARGVINLGHPEAPQLRDTLEEFAGHLGDPTLLRFGVIPHGPTSVMWLQPDVSCLTKLGWEPRVGLQAGLAMTARWLRGDAVRDPVLRDRTLPLVPHPPPAAT
jgi:nucleoside-diphosphate-sugar epimerase